MTPFKNQERIMEGLVAELRTLDHPKSWNVVVPPGFYPGQFAGALRERLRKEIPGAHVALVAADGVYSPKDFILQIHYEWAGDVPANTDMDAPPNILLAELLNKVGGGRNVLIISEFHRILGRMDERILVALRTAEQAGRINTVAVSMYPHKWLREKWKKEGQLLNVSNYGDHKPLGVEPYSLRDITNLLAAKKVPEALARMLYEWTGGFPECLDRVVDAWVDAGRPDLTPDTQERLRNVAQESLERVAQCVDPEGSTRFSQLILNIHQHVAETESHQYLSKFHPWAHVMLDEEGLRADALGDALTHAQMEQAFQAGRIGQSVDATTALAIRYYSQRQYDLAIKVLVHLRQTYDSPRVRLIESHARIMEGLRGGVSPSLCPDVDTEWRHVTRAISDARRFLPDVVREERLRSLMEDRYDEIEGLAKVTSTACEGEGVRFLDRIGGLLGAPEDRKTAFTLVVFQLQSASGIRGNTAACRAVMELPEQIIRLWGFWKHKVNYYKAPTLDPTTLTTVLEIWPDRQSPPRLVLAGQLFPSLYLFCYCLYALDLKATGGTTWPTANDIERELSILNTRNDIAHATVHMGAKTRTKVFDFIETWLSRLERDCMGSTTRESVMSVVSPLEVI